ncbi:CG42346 [Drosophila busckii]|uniref:CG42346 n=1 Tax=Drosophila busckii TaxID=30019 RepID=A0A0M5J3P3_DROBS|nr:CG42346 [Drosophila busckii]
MLLATAATTATATPSIMAATMQRSARSLSSGHNVLSHNSGKSNAQRDLHYELNTGAGSSSSSGSVGVGVGAGIECPSFDDSSACPCYKFEDGLFLECPGTTALSLRSTLERVSAPIHSLSIYDFDRSVTSLSQDVIQPGVQIRHLQFSHSHLEALKENSLRNVRGSLESLSIVNGKLTQVSQEIKAINFALHTFKLATLNWCMSWLTNLQLFWGLISRAPTYGANKVVLPKKKKKTRKKCKWLSKPLNFQKQPPQQQQEQQEQQPELGTTTTP